MRRPQPCVFHVLPCARTPKGQSQSPKAQIVLLAVIPDRILSTVLETLNKKVMKTKRPKYWDGKASWRIVKVFLKKLAFLQK